MRVASSPLLKGNTFLNPFTATLLCFCAKLFYINLTVNYPC
jgi:hypothetical protein